MVETERNAQGDDKAQNQCGVEGEAQRRDSTGGRSEAGWGREKVGSGWGNTGSWEGLEAKKGMRIVWDRHGATGCSGAAVGVRSWQKLAARE